MASTLPDGSTTIENPVGADCTATGPLHVRALSDEARAYFRIQDGQTARIRAHRGRIRCVVNPTEPQPPSSASQ